jgi:hypothetical protein
VKELIGNLFVKWEKLDVRIGINGCDTRVTRFQIIGKMQILAINCSIASHNEVIHRISVALVVA